MKSSNKNTKTQKISTKPSDKQSAEATEEGASTDFFEQLVGKKSGYLALGVISVLAMTTYGHFLFGNDVFLFKDIGSDTINVLYPNLYLVDQMFSEGLPGWSFHQGMGQNIFPFSAADPFNWLLFLTCSADNLAEAIAWIEFSKVITGGWLFYAFLRTRRLNNFTSIIGGLVYSASGFMMVGSGWYIFTTQAALVALLLWAFERLLMQGKLALLPIAVMFIAAIQPANLFVIGFLFGLYSVARMLDHYEYDLKKTSITLAIIFGLGALGLGLSGLWLLPNADQLLNSPRVLGDSSFFDSLANQPVFGTVDLRQGLTIIGRLFANDFLGTASNFTGWSNYLEAPMHYAGLATLLLVPQAFALMPKRQRVLYGLFLTIILLPLIFPFFRYAIWSFSGDYYRLYSLTVIVGLLVVALQGLNLINLSKEVNLTVLYSSLLFTLFFASFSFFNVEELHVKVKESSQAYVVLFLVVYALLISAWRHDGLRPMAKLCFFGLVVIELAILSSPTINGRNVITKDELDQKLYYNDYSIDALNYIDSVDNEPFYRISKTYFSGGAMHASTNDSKVQGFYGTKSYHSFNQLNYIRFLGALSVIDPSVEHQTRWTPGLDSRQLLNVMASNKYILSKHAQANVGHGYKPIHTVGDVTVHQNQNFIPFGFTYDKALLRSVFDRLSNLEKDIALLNAAVIEDEDMAAFSTLSKFDTATIPANYTLSMLAEDARKRGESSLDISTFSNHEIIGDIALDVDRVLFLSMPLDQGWAATINGEEAEVFRVNAGLTGLLVPAGQHEIALNYSIPYLQKGLWLSLISFILFGAAIWWFRYGKKPGDTALDKML